MEKIMIINGSPRAPKSNSKSYAELFVKYCKRKADYFNLSRTNHLELCARMNEYSDVLLVFPLYADALPVGLLNFLKSLEANPPMQKPVISMLVNCGFLEYQQNAVAVRMIRFFCKQNHYAFGSALMLGGGEAILNTPFKFIAKMSIRKLSKSVADKKYGEFHATMLLSKKMFLKASTRYWTLYGMKNGISKEQMQTMSIEAE